ncbi:MAG: hypothetical protein JWR10_798 [Rubritepida sp.]|nr:hypothetical protein [Rubritepida sp.]
MSLMSFNDVLIGRRRVLGVSCATLLQSVGASGAEDYEFDGMPDSSEPDFGPHFMERGNSEPSHDDRLLAEILLRDKIPSVGRPIDIARAFLSDEFPERFRGRWPTPGPWNPVISTFLDGVGFPESPDLIPWCAAFVGWCLHRGNKPTTGLASAQSFLSPNSPLRQTDTPREGDLAVFVLRIADSDEETTNGHVGFVSQVPNQAGVGLRLLAGNQSVRANGRLFHSVISDVPYNFVGRPFVMEYKHTNTRVYLKLKGWVSV